MKKVLPLIIAIAFGLGFLIYNKQTTENKIEKLIFADASKVWWTAPTIIAKSKGLFKKNNLKVNTFSVNTGLASKNAVINGNADIGLVASTPLAIGATKKEDILILGKYVSSSSLISILSEIDLDNSLCIKENRECDTLIEQLTMLYVPKTISEFYLLTYLEKHGRLDLLKKLKQHSYKLAPPAIPKIFGTVEGNRKINMAVIWEPLASKIRKSEKHTLMQSEPDSSLYELALYLVTTKKVWEKKKKEILKFVKAVSEAEEYMNNNSDEIRLFLEDKYGYDKGWLADRWNKVEFRFDTSSEKIKRLIERDGELALKIEIINEKPDLNYMLEILPEVRDSLSKK